MNPDQTVAVPFSMAVREKAKSGYYPIKFKIRYRENENGNFAAPVEDTFYVRVYGKDEADSLDSEAGENERTKARIIVDSFETDPAEIYAGQDFTLKVRMKNASNSIAASNILFTFESEAVSDSPVFTTVNGSNSVVVNSLAPGASDTLTIKFSSSPTAEQRSYTITINEQYDSPEFKNAKEAVKIAVGLKQEARLNTGTIEVMPDAISVGEESNVMFSINNTGKVMLYNVNAVFEADSIQKNECYVGNIEPGKSGNVDTMINGIAPTTDDGKVKLSITYEDENGKVSTVEKEIQLIHGGCPTHAKLTASDVRAAKKLHPNALLLVHPECRPEIVELADFTGSTTEIMAYAAKSDAREFIIGTENSIVQHLGIDHPEKLFFPLSKDCVCHNMKVTTIADVLHTLEGRDGFEINIEEQERLAAKRCIDEMLRLGE